MRLSRAGIRATSTLSAFVLLAVIGLAASAQQVADETWSPEIANPAFPEGNGPLVLVDSAHGNFHTIEGRFSAFARLLTADGYRVRDASDPVTPRLLDGADVFVIANAIRGGEDAEWRVPTPPAFAAEERLAIVEWVRNGGSLLLIADHMPFPGAAADLAADLGIEFHNGFAMSPDGHDGNLSFSRTQGTLADHPVTRGRSADEAVESVRSFTGQAFGLVAAGDVLLHVPADWRVLLPTEAWEFDANTEAIPAEGLAQGAVLELGSGRVAVFGEAAMFTAQTFEHDGMIARIGMNHPDAAENAQFVLNVMHWLTRLL
jgi:hypothetical protein